MRRLAIPLPERTAARGGGWRYPGGRRDLRLDLLRGCAVVAMVVNHVGGESSWLYAMTGGNRFFISAAEVFVLISGLVMGLVYARIIARDGLDAALAKVLRRAGFLYLLTVGMTLGYAGLSALLRLPWAPVLADATLPEYVAGVLTLHQTLYLADVLLLYALLVLVAGPLLLLLHRGRTRLVLGGSWLLWGLWQVWPAQAQLPWPIMGNETFHLPAWQVLFTTGLVAGFHRRALGLRLARISPWLVLVPSGASVAGAIWLYRTQFALLARVSGGEMLDMLTGQFYGKADVRVGRLLVLAGFFAFAFTLLTVAWGPIRRALAWLLLPLGQQALSAYVWHLFVVAAVVWLRPDLPELPRTAAENVVLQLMGVALIWLGLRLQPSLMGAVRAAVTPARGGPALVSGEASRR